MKAIPMRVVPVAAVFSNIAVRVLEMLLKVPPRALAATSEASVCASKVAPASLSQVAPLEKSMSWPVQVARPLLMKVRVSRDTGPSELAIKTPPLAVVWPVPVIAPTLPQL